MTDAFAMTSARKIVHTVGPVFRGESDPASLLASCYRRSLDLAADYSSIAFPAISTGIYGYPIADASAVAVATIRGWLAEHPSKSLRRVTLVAHSPSDLAVLSAAINA